VLAVLGRALIMRLAAQIRQLARGLPLIAGALPARAIHAATTRAVIAHVYAAEVAVR
jgi:hypothetical protein